MKEIKTFALALTFLLLLSCGNNNNNESTTATTPTEAPEAKQTETPEGKPANTSETGEGNGIAGEWEMEGAVKDTNDNLQIDEEERKNLQPAFFSDYMKLNSDGSGLFTVAKTEGRYEIKDESGKKTLKWFDKQNGPHTIGIILKIAKDELHIKEPGGSGLFVWKRM